MAGGWSLIADGSRGVLGGCLFRRWSMTVLPSGWMLSSCRQP